MNWRVRTALILGSALVLYLVIAWALAGGVESTGPGSEQDRLQALEQAQQQDRELRQEAQGRGTLFRLLVRNPDLGKTLLKGWSRQDLTTELGWPDQIEGDAWTYLPRFGGQVALRVIVDATGQVKSVIEQPLHAE